MKGQTLSRVSILRSQVYFLSQLEHREEEGATFDWFKKYEDVADILREAIPNKNARILMLGCGNSTLSEDVCDQYAMALSYIERAFLTDYYSKMYDDGYKNIVNIDYSGVVISRMKARHSDHRPEMECEFPSSKFW